MANDESPESNQRVIPHIDDGYTDGAIGPMFGNRRLSLSAKQLRRGDGPARHTAFWVGIPWRILLITCGAVIATVLIFGLLITLTQLGQDSDPYIGAWHGRSTSLTIEKTDDGWKVRRGYGQWLPAVERDGQLVTSGDTTLTIRREGNTLVMTRDDGKTVILVR